MPVPSLRELDSDCFDQSAGSDLFEWLSEPDFCSLMAHVFDWSFEHSAWEYSRNLKMLPDSRRRWVRHAPMRWRLEVLMQIRFAP